MSGCSQCGARVSEPARCLNGHVQEDRPPIQLEGFAELIAQKVKAMLADEFRVADAAIARRSDQSALVDVHEIARITGMSERWVYDRAQELGGVKAGTTKRARWRFDPDKALALLAERQGDAGPAPAPNLERRELPSDVELLQVRGRAA